MSGRTAPSSRRVSPATAFAVAVAVLGAVVVGGAAVAAALPSTPRLTFTPGLTGHLDHNGETISISVGANSLFAPDARIEVIECSAPGGRLPVSDTSCDGNTAQYGTVQVGDDGSFEVPGYTLLALPSAALDETHDGSTTCNESEACVLYIGEDQNDFSQPKIFSAPFTIDPSTPTPAVFAGSLATTPGSAPASGPASSGGSPSGSVPSGPSRLSAGTGGAAQQHQGALAPAQAAGRGGRGSGGGGATLWLVALGVLAGVGALVCFGLIRRRATAAPGGGSAP